MCERLKGEGVRELENAKKSWQQAEKDELKKRDQKISLKLKQDAAKKIEPKLRELIENHKEEAERLQREANRELDYYRLKLYKCSNEEYRKETTSCRARAVRTTPTPQNKTGGRSIVFNFYFKKMHSATTVTFATPLRLTPHQHSPRQQPQSTFTATTSVHDSTTANDRPPQLHLHQWQAYLLFRSISFTFPGAFYLIKLSFLFQRKLMMLIPSSHR